MLSTGARLATISTLCVSLLVSWVAWQQAAEAWAIEHLAASEPPAMPLASSASDPAAMRQALVAAHRAQVSAIEGMRSSRVAVLSALSLAAMVCCLFALRLRWGAGPRAQSARVLSAAGLVAAVARTADGAQQLAIARRAAAAIDASMPSLPAQDALFSMRGLATVVTVGQTVAVVALFTFAWRYFDSPGLRALAGRLDAQDANDDAG